MNNPINNTDPLGLLCNGSITNIEGEWGEWSINPTDMSFAWKTEPKGTWDKVQPKAQFGALIIKVSGEASASVNCTGCCGCERINWSTNASVTATVSPEFPIKKGLLPLKWSFILKGLFMSDYIGDSYTYKAIRKFNKEIQKAISALGDATTYCKLSAKALEK